MMKRNSEILIHNCTKSKLPRQFLRENVEKILRCLKKPAKPISLILVPPLEIKKLNDYWRGKKNKATTVLTFSEGDIFLCPEEIKRQALKRQISQKKFYQLLLVHSILHLFGYTHDNSKDAKKMELLESKIFQSLV